DLRNAFVRPVTLKSGAQFSFVYRHSTRDITKNHPAETAAGEIERLLANDFLDAHLFTSTQQAQLETQTDGTARLRLKQSKTTPIIASHDKQRHYAIAADSPWLRALGVTNERGQPREGMASKFRQIQ